MIYHQVYSLHFTLSTLILGGIQHLKANPGPLPGCNTCENLLIIDGMACLALKGGTAVLYLFLAPYKVAYHLKCLSQTFTFTPS